MKWQRMIFFLVLFSGAIGWAGEQVEAVRTRIVCSVYPVYQLTRLVTQGQADLDVSLLLPGGLGCPHDYSLTPQDMQKIAKADILVVNGLGLEEFLGAPVKKANPDVRIIDSSEGVEGLLEELSSHEHEGHVHEAGKDDLPAGKNSHLFASPRMAARQAVKIAEGLAQAHPAGAEVFRKNAESFGKSMETLNEEFEEVVKLLSSRKIVVQHDVFAYFARDVGLEIVAVIQGHPGTDPAAAEVLKLLKTIREKKAAVIFVEPQYSAGVAATLAKEASLPMILLDPVATGPADAGLDYYEKTMRKNLSALKAMQEKR